MISGRNGGEKKLVKASVGHVLSVMNPLRKVIEEHKEKGTFHRASLILTNERFPGADE